jgi:hypothetical protein
MPRRYGEHCKSAANRHLLLLSLHKGTSKHADATRTITAAFLYMQQHLHGRYRLLNSCAHAFCGLGSVLKVSATSPFLMQKHWTTPDRSPTATFCVLFSPGGSTCTTYALECPRLHCFIRLYFVGYMMLAGKRADAHAVLLQLGDPLMAKQFS